MTNQLQKLQQFIKNKKEQKAKQLIGVAVPQKTYIELKQESHIKQVSIQSIIRQKLQAESKDTAKIEFIVNKVDKLLNEIKKAELLKNRNNGK
jgi:hypothetical protein